MHSGKKWINLCSVMQNLELPEDISMGSTMPDSVVEEAIEVIITFSLEATLKCPICDLSYAMYTLWTRNLNSHAEPVSL